MAVEEIDPVSGRATTGHEWNGNKELDTPVPRGVGPMTIAMLMHNTLQAAELITSQKLSL